MKRKQSKPRQAKVTMSLADMRHPMQPIGHDEHGTARFKANPIVRFLLDWASSRGMSMNELAVMPFDNADREHFAQLIGYSISGFGELSYSHPSTVAIADQIAERIHAEKQGQS